MIGAQTALLPIFLNLVKHFLVVLRGKVSAVCAFRYAIGKQMIGMLSVPSMPFNVL